MQTALTTYFSRLLTIALLIVCTPLFSETTSIPQIDPGKPATPPTPDRKGGQGAAAAMAAAAAAMQGVSCMMMMNEARKMPPGSEKTMMMMMAMQQCSQAAQTAANAAQNKDGKDKASAGDPGTPPSLKTEPFQSPAATKDEALANNLQTSAPSATSAADSQLADSTAESGPEFKPVSNEPTPSGSLETTLAKGPAAPGFSTPNTIERSKLGYDESGKASENPTPDRALGSGTTVATARPAGGDLSKNGTDGKQEFAPNNLDAGTGRKGKGGGEAGEGGVGASDGGTGTGGNGEGGTPAGNPLDAMMALLGGGGAAPEGPKGQISDISALAGGNKPGGGVEDAPNIFEYATFRYKKLTYDDNRLRVKDTKQAKSETPGRPALAHSASQ